MIKPIIAVLSSCLALGAQSVGGDVVTCTAPVTIDPPSVTQPQVIPENQCGCGGSITIVNVHVNVHITNHVHINIHNNIYNKKKK